MLARTCSVSSSSMLIVSASSWLMAKMPRMTGRMSKPDVSDRAEGQPVDARRRIEARHRHQHAEERRDRPLSMDPRLREAISTSAMHTTAKISQGPNTTATRASSGVRSTSATQEKRAADDGRRVAEAQRPARPSGLRHRVAVHAGHDRVRLAGNAHQGRGDEPAADAAHEQGDQQHDRVHALHRERERQDQHHQRARVDPGQHADGDARG